MRRTPEGGLGIQVDETNTVASCPGQPDLAIGDRVVAINGEQLGRRYLTEVLPPPAEFASESSGLVLLSPMLNRRAPS